VVILRARGPRTTPHLVVGVTGHDAPPRPPRGPRLSYTKWDLITAAERRALDATPFSDGTQGCSGCHTPPPTAGDVARHYLVPDLRDKKPGRMRHQVGRLTAQRQRRARHPPPAARRPPPAARRAPTDATS
jgi:mono/diheme cytochrome c family protein